MTPVSLESARIRAAQYVRMSTEHQQYSTANQMNWHQRYAQAHGMEIVKTYSDAGKSGLQLSGRGALRELLNDVQNGRADYSAVLVYDVSRWGRFLDTDESAYYEYICKKSNVRVHYCAEQFANDDSLSSTLLKTMKRTMAGEYSRELSNKVFAGHCRLVELGFRQGGIAGYGLRRQLVTADRKPKALLELGMRKSIQSDRIVLVAGPDEEVAIVREIYRRFTKDGQTEQEITDWLNGRGILTDLGRPWTTNVVHQILTNPKYIGSNVFYRGSTKLKQKRVKNPPEMWVRCDNAFQPIITPEQFAEAQAIVNARQRLTDEQMLDGLKNLLARLGTLSAVLIDETEGIPTSDTYRNRFGNLSRAYKLIGYTPSHDYSYVERNREIRQYHHQLCSSIIDQLRQNGASIRQDSSNGLLKINDEFTASLVLCPCRETSGGSHRWFVRLHNSLNPDITLAARLKPGNQDVLDYYLLPSMEALGKKMRLAPVNGVLLDVYRFDGLDFFINLARRVRLEEVA